MCETIHSELIVRGCRVYPGANLSHAYLENVDFSQRDLHDVTFRYSNLWGSNFQGCCLRGVDFRGADLCGADLRGADITGVRFSLTQIMTGMKITQYQAVLSLLSGQLTPVQIAVMEVSDSDS